MATTNSTADADCSSYNNKESLRGRPQVTNENIVQILQNVYGFKVVEIQELDSYMDRNYHVLIEDKHTNPHIAEISQHGYIFKVHNETETNAAQLDAQLEVMQLLAKNGFSCSKPVLNVHGEYRSTEKIRRPEIINNTSLIPEINSDPEHIVRLLTYLPGKRLVDIYPTPELLCNVGLNLAEMNRILQDYRHPSLLVYPECHVSYVSNHRHLVDLFDNLENQQLLHQALLTFETEVVPMFDCFQRGVIHTDYHAENVIIQPSSTIAKEPRYHVSGVIDFGDISEYYYVFEVGIALTHVMMDSPEDALAFAGHLLAGYLSKFKLNREEIMSLPGIINARLVQILLVGADFLQTDPENEYIAHWGESAWLILRKLSTLSKDDIFHEWKRVVESYDNVSLEFML